MWLFKSQKSIKGTQTEKNLLKSFAGESQARMRYDYFAKQAKKEWLVQISNIFAETALNEKEHAKRFFKFLEWWEQEITATFQAGKISTTLENLKSAAEWEHEERENLYPKFAKIAKKEGFDDIADTFTNIAKVEKAHEERYKTLYTNLEAGIVFKRWEILTRKCNNCWYLHQWTEAPEICPACLHPQAHFQIKENNY